MYGYKHVCYVNRGPFSFAHVVSYIFQSAAERGEANREEVAPPLICYIIVAPCWVMRNKYTLIRFTIMMSWGPLKKECG